MGDSATQVGGEKPVGDGWAMASLLDDRWVNKEKHNLSNLIYLYFHFSEKAAYWLIANNTEFYALTDARGEMCVRVFDR